MAGGLHEGRAVPKNVTPRDAKHLKAVAALPCVLWQTGECFGDVVAHHTEVGGTGMKGSDYRTAPLCVCHHDALHKLNGYFAGWDGETCFAWEFEAVEQTLATLNGLKAGKSVTW